ncbi:MAG: hypothetical protein R3194_03835 [Limnobacter sp.]|nr:hypothetical protein [Limnobacter sp.]
MKKLISTVLLATSLLATGAYAHGEKPRHGGVMSEAKDLNFELVAEGSNAALYVLDHGAGVPTASASGKLLVLSGGKKAEVTMVPAGENKLVSSSEIVLGAGAKAIATIDLGDKRPISVRFSIK